MADKIDPKDIKGWVTRGGKHVPITDEKDPEKEASKVKDNEKETKKEYFQRYNLAKTPFKIRDTVYYDKMQKSGQVFGLDGEWVRILDGRGQPIGRHKNDVFKSSELIKGWHWDAMTQKDRYNTLIEKHVSTDYVSINWASLPYEIRRQLTKGEGGVSTGTAGAYNPMNQHKTLSQKIEDEKTRDNKKV